MLLRKCFYLKSENHFSIKKNSNKVYFDEVSNIVISCKEKIIISLKLVSEIECYYFLYVTFFTAFITSSEFGNHSFNKVGA